MKLWIIEPRDPLIVRDGKPFGPDPGARSRSLDFPLPSVTTGGARTLAGNLAGGFENNPAMASTVLQLATRGPLLVGLDRNDVIETFYVAAPQDALVVKDEGANDPELKQLTPQILPAGVFSNLNSFHNGSAPTLEHITFAGVPSRAKPYRDFPRYWRWEQFERWLTAPGDQVVTDPASWGTDGVTKEFRMHVGIDRDSQSADTENGALFQTSGLEFSERAKVMGKGNRLAMAIGVEAPATNQSLSPGAGLFPLGGERRLVRWSLAPQQDFPAIPSALLDAIIQKGLRRFRMILVTPAHFEAGYYPSWLTLDSAKAHNVQVTLKAIATPRPVTASGWRFDVKPQRPKKSRRLAAAGSVYWVELSGNASAVEQWARAMWLACISDDDQSRRDGFGMAAIGVW